MKIEVKAVDIRKGEPNRASYCPVALALKRAFPGARIVDVDRTAIHVDSYGKGDGCKWKDTPARVRKFIERFDAGDLVKPFSFRF